MLRLLVLVAVGSSLTASAEPVKLVVTKGPVITGVTQREAWVAWETSAYEGVGQLCPKGPVPTVRFTSAQGRSSSVKDRTCTRIHHAHLTRLKAGTSYTLTLDQPYPDGAPSQARFSTAAADKRAAFRFVVYGDNREPMPPAQQTRDKHEAVSAAILKYEPEAAFLIHTGDLALNVPAKAGADRGYAEFFDVERAILASRAVYAVVGNHETLDMAEYDALVNPASFTPKMPHPYYSSMDWGPAHFVFLDSFEGPPKGNGEGFAPGLTDAQLQWAEADLAAARKAGQVIFVVTHQGPYSHFDAGSKGHGGSVEEQQKLVPLLRKYSVAAVFAGHDHYYEHGHEGCVDYFVIGGGGAPMYKPDATAPGVIKAQEVLSYLVVDVRDGQVTATAKNTANEPIDGPSPIAPFGLSCQAP